MMLNSNREKLIDIFKLPSSQIWIMNDYWCSELNERILNWISQQFIFYENPFFNLHRKQIIQVWEIFRNWLAENHKQFDIYRINLETLEEFGQVLPMLNWSISALQFIEVVIIILRQYLSQHSLLEGNPWMDIKWPPKDYLFSISVDDYLIFYKFFSKESNDYEQTYFDLVTMNSLLKSPPAIQGKDIIFKKKRAYIVRHIENMNGMIPCPLPLSQRLLKLLRSRDILADENLFQGTSRYFIINEKKFEKKIKELCLGRNIPLFCQHSIYGFQKQFMLKSLNKSDISPYFLSKTFFNEKQLKLLDEMYYSLIGDTGLESQKVVPFNLAYAYPQRDKKQKGNSMLIGYAWAFNQDTEFLRVQLEILKRFGCQRIYIDMTNDINEARPELEAAHRFLREGDTFVVWKIYCMPDFNKNPVEIVNEFQQKGIKFTSIQDDIFTKNTD